MGIRSKNQSYKEITEKHMQYRMYYRLTGKQAEIQSGKRINSARQI
jgi:hypothetical protein